ncbi:hypothetical protein Nmel_014982, partial [Mimus melanotis]
VPAAFGVRVCERHTHGTSPCVLQHQSWVSQGSRGSQGALPTHLAKVPGDAEDVIRGALVDKPVLGQHVLTSLILVTQENCVLCGDSK